jgi:hypothetical protein
MVQRAFGVVLVAGWILLSPPVVKDSKAPGGARADASAKLEDWNQVSAHDSASDCERAKSEKALSTITMMKQLSGKKDAFEEAPVDAAMHSLCVPSEYLYGTAPGDQGECTGAPTQL